MPNRRGFFVPARSIPGQGSGKLAFGQEARRPAWRSPTSATCRRVLPLGRSFLSDLRAWGASPNTLRAYRTDLDHFGAYAVRVGEVPAERADAKLIALYIGSLTARGLKASSVRRHLWSLRSYYRFLIRRGRVRSNEAKLVMGPRRPGTVPRLLTEEQVAMLLAVDYGKRPRDVRDLALLEFLYATGSRVAEAVGVDLEDLKRHTEDEFGEAILRGKGGKERMVVIGTRAMAALRPYLLLRSGLCRSRRAVRKALFLNKSGRRLDVRGVRRILDKRVRLAGLDVKIGPHALRHSFATHLLNRGAPVWYVQELMGHANVATTAKYWTVIADDVFRNHARGYATTPFRRRDLPWTWDRRNAQ